MPERRRTSLRPLPPDLADPVRAFVEEFREIFERLGLNQRELAEKLHLSKSPISRYLNGQEVVPAEALDQVCQLARLSPQERTRLHDLRDHAKAALSGDVVSVEKPPVGGWSRRLLWGIPVVVAIVGAAVVLVLTSQQGKPDRPGCAQPHRQYTASSDGDVLDGNRHVIGDLRHGETFVRDTPPPNPYKSRYYGRIVGRNVTGFVDPARLDYLGEICD